MKVIPVTKGGWKTTSVLLFNVNVNLSQMKVTCSAYNDLYNNVIQETKTVTILSKFLFSTSTMTESLYLQDLPRPRAYQDCRRSL